MAPVDIPENEGTDKNTGYFEYYEAGFTDYLVQEGITLRPQTKIDKEMAEYAIGYIE